MSDLLSSLNPEQRAAVLHVEGPLLILAGAGSGKTRVIAHRIAHLIASGRARPDDILAVTFTNKAAEEMLARVESLSDGDCSGVWLSTFHSLCARLLRREAPAIGLTRDFVIYDSADQLAVVKQAMKELRIDEGYLPPRLALARISHARNRMEGPDSFLTGGSLRGEQLARVHRQYQKILTQANALDFDDLLLKTVELVDQSDEVRTRYARRFRFVMVDEYQDTNRPQYLLVRRFAEGHRNLAVVGDPDQSIYKWRGADLRNILDFEQDFPEATIVRLEQNYRSSEIILDAASAVIRQNRNRKDKRLWTERHGGDRIQYFRASDELEEADFITRTARAALADDHEATVAVLYRINAQSRAIEDALLRQGLPYRIVGGVRFYERREIKDALGYLKLLVNPHDDVSFKRVVNAPPRGIGKGMMDSLDAVRAPLPDSLWMRMCQVVDERLLPARAVASLKVFRDLVMGLTEVARSDSVSIAIGKMLDQTGYLQDLRQERSEEAEARIQNLMELVSAAKEYEAREAAPTLVGFVDRLSLLSEVDEEAGSRTARIWLMTLHSAKGLEFPVVVMAGLEEGLFPHSRSIDEESEMEEERRLCYVGMTRAQARLILTGAARRRVFGEYQSTNPSRFIKEVPEELVDRIPDSGSSYYRGAYPARRFSSSFRSASRRPDRVREEGPAFAYEDEDQSRRQVRPGSKVRHPQFGLGTVLDAEELGDDMKLVVRFEAVGRKTLRAKYAKLELA